MDADVFDTLFKEWRENRAIYEKHQKLAGAALRTLVWTLADEGKSQIEISRLIGLGRRRVQEVMNKNRVLTPGYEDLHKSLDE